MVDPAQTQTANRVAMRLLGTDQAFDLRHFDCLGLRHDLPQNLVNHLAALCGNLGR